MTTATKPDDYVSYGYSAALGAAVPEIGALLKKAAAGGWDVQRFQDALQATSWWKQNSDSAKQMIAMEKQDPAQYGQEYTAAQNHVKQMAASLGVSLTAAQIKNQATLDLWQGLDDATLQSQIGALYSGSSNPAGGGTAVSLTAQLHQLVSQYGVPVTQSWIDNQVRNSLETGNGVEGAQAALSQMAASTFPALAAQLQAGMTTEQVAQPYMAAMSQILEIPDSQLTLQDPTIMRALQGTMPVPNSGSGGGGGVAPKTGPKPAPGNGVSGGVVQSTPTLPKASTAATAGLSGAPSVPESIPLWQFQNQLRQDPRWQQTDNAKSTAYSMLHNLGQAWGFAS